MANPNIIRIAAAIISNAEGSVLLVRKRGTVALMQAGGKIDAGEDSLSALKRELREELGLNLEDSAPEFVGNFVAPAANEDGYTLEAAVFRITNPAKIVPQAEIEEVAWIDPKRLPDRPLAPLSRMLLNLPSN